MANILVVKTIPGNYINRERVWERWEGRNEGFKNSWGEMKEKKGEESDVF